MTEAMPFLQKYDITFLRPLPIPGGRFLHLILSAQVRFFPQKKRATVPGPVWLPIVVPT